VAHPQGSEANEARGAGESGLQARALPGYSLRQGAVDHPLNKSPLLVGRSSDADIVLSGLLVSLRHAEFHETEAGVVVIDLDSENGVFVNGVAIAGPTALLNGDRLTIGDNELVLTELNAPRVERTSGLELNPVRAAARGHAPIEPGVTEEASAATRRADALRLLSTVADKALALGRGKEAEHVLGTHLVATLSDAAAGRAVAPEVARIAAQYAVKLATAMGKASWLDFAIRLYDALGETIPLPIVDEMYTVLRHVRGIDRELLRKYTAFLQARSAQSTPPERFVLQRLEGLERLAAWHPAMLTR
jgi:hypothetical protein